MEPGGITVISHSLGLDPKEAARAEALAALPTTFIPDPRGDLYIRTEDGEIRATHNGPDGTRLAEYTAKSASRLAKLLTDNQVLGDVSHALYVGRELQRMEQQLKEQV